MVRAYPTPPPVPVDTNRILTAIGAAEQIIIKELRAMSQSLGAQLSAAEAQEKADATALAGAVSSLSTAVTAFIALFQNKQAGDAVTQEMVDGATQVDAAVVAAKAAVDQIGAAVSAASPPVEPPPA